ncbi:sensor histidine kinase [Actinophytocola xanthii]|uniref:Histidine kinase/HSP90-like ATPase domain-containing protein n=1 Tax=Actinophytocola xanthii TaxID=1912961 RepID=A0A1Q8CTF9_9PSEU|nr:ATP-binding protein [Actinophytocola xanthii]OLF17648.1 hypothetical protein BU204_10550 [Actinophytocola xanthii]
MRTTDKRVVEAVSAYLVHAAWKPDPLALARTIGTAAGAAGCVLTVGDVPYRWGVVDIGWPRHEISYAGRRHGLFELPESAGPLPRLAKVLGVPVAMLRVAADVERLRRQGDVAARQLVDDRWRAVVDMEHERRRLERDLHDGAQHHLVALRMSLAVLEHTSDNVSEQLARLRDRLDAAQRVLIDTASGILPVSLASHGIAAALTADLAGHTEVTLDVGDARRRYPPAVESAVYFVCLEAVGNAQKHAPGARITVRALDDARGIQFTVTDTGPGFTLPHRGSGLHNMATRIAAVGGTVEVRSAPGEGTSVSGFAPR